MTLSPGVYFIGDPWFAGQTVDVGQGFPTDGDGVWVDQDGCEYLIESEYIGAYPIEGNSPKHKNGRVLKFACPFTIENMGGMFRFGTLQIKPKDT